jgi:hypothetical protein
MYREAGRPFAGPFEAFLQGISEIVGSLGYPYLNNTTKLLWNEIEEAWADDSATGEGLLRARLAKPARRSETAP